MNPKIIMPVLLGAVILLVGGVFLLNQSPQPQPTPNPTPSPAPAPQLVNEISDEKIVTKLIEALPDMELLSRLPLQQGTEGITIRVVERPESNDPYFVVEVWEDLSGESMLFQRYRYNTSANELIIDLPLNPSKFDIVTRSVLDEETGKVIAIIYEEKKEECAVGSQFVLNFCAGRAADLADDVLNFIYRRILANDAIPQARKDVLIEEERAWIQKKESECERKEGSIAPLEEAT